MLKKILLGTFFIGLIGVLIAGGVIRTLDRTERTAEAASQGERNENAGQGRGQNAKDGQVVASQGRGRETNQNELEVAGQGRGQNSAEANSPSAQGGGNGNGGQGRGTEGNYSDAEPVAELTLEGTVVQSFSTGEELVIETAAGEQLQIGTGPIASVDPNFALQLGETVQVKGYWEDEEFKATQLTRLQDGYTVELRNEFGRPAWAGNQGTGGGSETLAGGEGQAEVDAWLQLKGTVLEVSADGFTVQTTDGEIIVVEGRPWTFAQEQGLVVAGGDQVTLIGFYEAEDFEVGQIDNLSSGLSVAIREASGRPLWAGRGRQGS